MCGICGWLSTDGVDLQSLVTMNRLAAHRGPDGEGYWLYNGTTPTGTWLGAPQLEQNLPQRGMIGLAHRRLAIIDLSDAGLQPMPSADKQQWIIFNGEIFNYLELRNVLRALGHVFCSESDTEVILASYRQWGTDCFNRFNGMWALAIVDLEKRLLVIARDRLGIKPFYYWRDGNSLAFASEIKQFLGLPGFDAQANLDAVLEYIDSGYEIPPETFFQHLKAFPPASFAEIPLDAIAEPQPQRFWKIEEFTQAPVRPADVADELRFLFADAVRLRLRSDVPVGVCLSGGLDSSLIYGQIQRLREDPGNTHAFSASYHEQQFDESPFVTLVLRKHGGQVHYAFPDAQAFLTDFDAFIYQHDEPPAAISQYAAWAVMRSARAHGVPVLLNGQGGDELFSGYWPAYYLYLRRHPMRAPAHLLQAMLPGGNPELLREIPAHLRQYLSRKDRANRRAFSQAVLARVSPKRQNWASAAQQISPEDYRRAEICQIHLPRLLKWDDRNSMAFAVEGRYPFLDYRLVEFAMRLPVAINLHAGWNKYLLRSSFGPLLPPAVQWRRDKVGFVTPQSLWMQTALKPVLTDWVQQPSATLAQVVDLEALRQLARKLFSSRSIHPMNQDQHLLFRLFALDVWLKRYRVHF